MYNDYFGLKEAPFSIAPDPRYLYMSDQHREALAHLLYGINCDGGFVLITGGVGTGKTTVCRCLLEQVPENCDIALIFNPKLSVRELLSTICDELYIDYPAGNESLKVFVDCINKHLLDAHARGRKTVLIIDEAQNLEVDVLEQLRLLTNLETNRHKLLQIILVGQPELRERLQRPELRQLAQRIIARYHLGPLAREEVVVYINHRLTVAGFRRQLFPAPAVDRIYRLSGGVPRLINLLCDRALLGTYVQGREKVELATVDRAAQEVFGEITSRGKRRRKALGWLAAALVVICLGVLLSAAYHNRRQPPFSGEPPAVAKMERPPLEPHRREIPKLEKPAADERPPKDIEMERLVNLPVRAELPEPLQWPLEQPMMFSEAMAYQSLFKEWGVAGEARSSAAACRQAQTLGLGCLSGQMTLDELRKYNLPAVLKLFSEEGDAFFATVTALQERTATFVVADRGVKVSLDDVALRWRGHYTLFWRMPPGYQGAVQPGERGPVVEWLNAQLARAQGKSFQSGENVVFDAAMLDEIKKFQFSRGLRPDGIVGPQTLICLNAVVDESLPSLTKKEEDL